MKMKLIVGALLLSSITVFAQHRSIIFEQTSFKEIKEKALKENKLIFKRSSGTSHISTIFP